MTDHELAERLLAVVRPSGDVIESAVRAGEDVIAVAQLLEQAAILQIAIPRDLLDAVGRLADEEDGTLDLDEDDITALREDIAAPTPITPVRA